MIFQLFLSSRIPGTSLTQFEICFIVRERENRKTNYLVLNKIFLCLCCETEIFPSSVVSWFVSKCIIIFSVEGNAGEICSKIGCTGPDGGSGRVKSVPAGTVSYIMIRRTSTVISL